MSEQSSRQSTLRKFVRSRARSCCEYCQSRDSYTTEPFVLEHIFPRSQGGLTTLDNLAYACSGCNGHKYTKIQAIDPQTGELVSPFHPRRQQWSDHFTWSSDTTEMVGLTKIGRATIHAMKLNRQPLVNLRRILRLANEHPPAD